MAGLILSSCVSVKIQDFEVCGDGGEFGATCAHFLSTDTRDIDKAQWDKERFGQLCVTPEAFGEWKREIEKLCSGYGRCTVDEKKTFKGFFDRMSALGVEPSSL